MIDEDGTLGEGSAGLMWPALAVLSLLAFGCAIFLYRDAVLAVGVVPFIMNVILMIRMNPTRSQVRKIDYGAKSPYQLWSRHLIGWLLLSFAYLLGLGGH